MRALKAATRLLRFAPRGPTSALAVAWGALWAALLAFGGFAFLEEPLADLLWRASQPGEHTTTAWVVFSDEDSAARGWQAGSVDSMRRLLERAKENLVAGVVVLDPRAAPGLAEVLREGPPPVRVLVPSRRHDDPYLELEPEYRSFFRGLPEPPPAGTYEEGVLDLRPDADGTWRRTALRDFRGVPTLAGLLAPADLAGRPDVRHWLTGPAGVESRISLWRVATGDLAPAEWRGSIWIFESDSSMRSVWSAEGAELPEARALAQVADGLRRRRWHGETPWWGLWPVATGLFLLSWLAASHLSPVRGLLALCGGCALALAGFWGLRVGLLWFIPLVPVVPGVAAGYLCGLAERHRVLRRGMADLLIRLGRSRVLNPIVTRPASNEHDVAAFRALVDLDAAALFCDDPERPLTALSTREGRSDLWDWFPAGVHGLVEAAQSSTERPLFYRPPEAGPAVIVEGLPRRGERRRWLALVPPAEPQAWWQDHRVLVGRAMVPLASYGGAIAKGEEAPKAEQIAVPEQQLKVLRQTVDQTELERTFLLGFLDRLGEGVLVCDLVGRSLIYNKRFQKMAEELAVDFDDPLIAFITTISGQSPEQVWHAIGQTIRSGARWTLYSSVQRYPVKHYMSNLVKLDLGAGEGQNAVQGVSDVLALVVTEVSDLYEAERLKSELLEHFVHDVRNAVTIIAQAADEVMEVTEDEGIRPDLEMISAQAMGIAERFKRMAALAGISAEKIADELTPTDLVAEAKRAINAATALAERLGIILAYDGQTVVPFCTARPNGLRQAMLQVIEQALSSSPRGSTVTIGAQDEGQDVVLRINDPGWSPMVAISRMRSAVPTGTTVKFSAPDALEKVVESAGGKLSTDFDEAVGTSVKLAFPKVSNRLEDMPAAERTEEPTAGDTGPAPVPGQLP